MRTIRKKPVTSNPRVTHVSVESRALVEFGAADPIWRWLKRGQTISFGKLQVEGCIAKITPPAGTIEQDVLTVENSLYACGALAVRRMPSPPEDKVVAAGSQESSEIDEESSDESRSLTQVAVDRAKRATSCDVDALVELVELAMAKGER
jgi:hypothetical protein